MYDPMVAAFLYIISVLGISSLAAVATWAYTNYSLMNRFGVFSWKELEDKLSELEKYKQEKEDE